MSESDRTLENREQDALEMFMNQLNPPSSNRYGLQSLGTLQGLEPRGLHKVEGRVKEVKTKVDKLAPKVDNVEKGIRSTLG